MYMPNKPHYKGNLEKLPYSKIYINIEYLEKGQYELNIINNNKLIKKTQFRK